MTNAGACETRQTFRLFHSNHLLYPFLGSVWYHIEKLFGYKGYAIYSLARANAILMSAALALFTFALSRVSGKSLTALATLCLGATYSVWHYAVDGRAIGASVFFSVCVIAAMLHYETQKKLTRRPILVLAGLSALTALVHGIAIFHVVPVAWWLKRKTKEARVPVLYLTAVGGVLAGFYVAIYAAIHGRSVADFIRFTLGYAAFKGSDKILESGFWANDLASATVAFWNGWARAICAVPPFSSGRIVADGLALLTLLLLLCGFRLGWTADNPQEELIQALVGWGILIGAFLLFWSPGQEGFRLHMLVPWWSAAVLGGLSRPAIRWAFGILAAVLFGLNFSYAMYPAAFIENNVGYQVLSAIEPHTKPGDVVISAGTETIPNIEVLLPYFFPHIRGGGVSGRLMAFGETSLEPLRTRLMQQLQEGARVYFADDMFEEYVQQQVEHRAGLQGGAMKRFVEGFVPSEVIALPNHHLLVRVEKKPI